MDIRPLVALTKGLVSNIPVISYLGSTRATGGAVSARYCYSIWLRHLCHLANHGGRWPLHTIAELGPGDSLGIGIAAILSGSTRYYGLDLVKYSNTDRNLKIYKELVELFKNREDIPTESEFPEIKPAIDSYKFPNHILTPEIMANNLSSDRLLKIEQALISLSESTDISISYTVPWNVEGSNSKLPPPASIDLIFSQAVLEHVDDLESTYRIFFNLLKKGGFTSHQVDFRSHGTASRWNGHWSISDKRWSFIRGKRPFLLNRAPYSVHFELLKKQNFTILEDIRYKLLTGIERKELAARFREISEEDFVTSAGYFLASKLVA